MSKSNKNSIYILIIIIFLFITLLYSEKYSNLRKILFL